MPSLKAIIENAITSNSYTYNSYMKLMTDLAENKGTTGVDQSASLVEYTYLNYKRMSRLNKTIQLEPELKETLANLNTKLLIVVLTEAWCGDAAQNLPLFHVIEGLSKNIELKLVLRDEHLELMDEFLTNGGRSIPKAIFLNPDTMEVLDTWGPRPKEAQNKVLEFKKTKGDYSEFVKTLQLWYAKDKTISQQKEILSILKSY